MSHPIRQKESASTVQLAIGLCVAQMGTNDLSIMVLAYLAIQGTRRFTQVSQILHL
jgi:hypothetical protein